MQYILTSLILFPTFIFGNIYNWVPYNKSCIDKKSLLSYLAWAFIGNDDDGAYGEKPSAGNWTNEKIGPKRAFMWWMRNPMHNFTFYVIGSAHKKNSEVTLLKFSEDGDNDFFSYHSKGKTVFAGKGTSFFLGFHGGKPFLSLRIDYGRRFDFYIGWRERGNFGIKLIPSAPSLRLKPKKCYPIKNNCHRNCKHGTKKKI
jgi:hypothetical protein